MSADHIAARNRSNAQNSTGPKTAKGKAVVAGNARKHGVTGRPDPDRIQKWLAIILNQPNISLADLMPDDDHGTRHQKFIVKAESGLTLLVAHNIDLAPRIKHLRQGDRIRLFGEYEWSQKGGVFHWTHHDPNGRHIGGWIDYQGKRYQ